MNKDAYLKDLTTPLEDSGYLADGGTLAFVLRHGYPVKNNLKHV